jgi:putative aldouronate transport system substrate-binding protein
LLLVLAALLFVAAGAWAGGGGEKPATGTAATDASKLAPYNLVWYMRGRGPEKDEAIVEDALNKYLKPRINATIKIICIDRGAFPERSAALVASGEAFDMIFTASWVLNYAQYAQKGAFVWLNDPKNNLEEKYLKGTVAALGDFYYGGSAIDGKHYAIPVNKEWAHSNGFVLRKDIMDKDGIAVPPRDMKLADMEPIFQAVHDKEPGMYAVMAYANNSPLTNYIDWDFIAGTRVPVVDYQTGPDKKLYNMWERPETLAYYKLIRSWYLKGFIRKDAASTEDYTPDTSSGKLFSTIVVTHPGQPGESIAGYGFPFIVVNNTPAYITNGETQGAMNAISITSKDPARAAMFMELENTDPWVNNTVAFGVEGVHWVKTATGQITFPKGLDAKTSGYVPAVQWAFGNQFLNYLWTDEDPNKWKNYLAYNKTATPGNTLAFIPDYEPIKTEIAALNNVWAEFEPGLDVGSSDPDVYVPQAVAKAKAAGIDKVIAELQKQYDTWRAKNKK